MNVSVFGLGYVGCVSVACLSDRRHKVIGVDVVKAKVDAIAHGFATVVEPHIDRLLADGYRDGRISATLDPVRAVRETDVSIICVGTPTGRDGSLDLSALRATAASLGNALKSKPEHHLIVMRSTVPPGTAENVVAPMVLKRSQRTHDAVGLVVVPEFLREGTAVKDYYEPPLSIVGTWDGEPNGVQGDMATLLAADPERIEWVQYRQAEMMKSLCNIFHAMKVVFANEVGALCQAMEIDGRTVMRLLTLDHKLNISPAYLRPGLPYGGSCLPKDLRAVVALAGRYGVDLPLLHAIGDSNDVAKRRACATASRLNGFHRVGMDGVAFKAGTDDLRESPLVEIAEHLLGKGFDVRILDPAVEAARLNGANREHIEKHIPHLTERLVSSPEELIEHSEALILTRDDNALFEQAAAAANPPYVIDLTGAGRTLGEHRLKAVHPAELEAA
jgi:GDP-mannose 6-dehydrogenase